METREEVQGNVRPGAPWGVKRVQESSGNLVKGFPPGTHGAGGEEFPGVAGYGWPPELLVEEVMGAGNPMVAR